MPKESELVVDTEGHCFLCMKTTRVIPVKQEPDSNTVYSFQGFSRYVSMNQEKVFHERDSIPAYLLAKVKRSELKVELCGGCAKLYQKFSKLYQQMEKVEMEMSVCAKLMHEKLKESETPNEFNSIGKLEVAKVLRTEAMEKCSRKLHAVVPQVKFQNLTSGQLNKRRRKYGLRQPRYRSENVTKSENRWLEAGQDSSSPMDPIRDDDDYDNDNLNFYADDSDPDISEQRNQPSASPLMEFTEVVVKREESRLTSYPAQAEPLPKSKAIINPETGKYKCELCSKEFSATSSLNTHFKSIHLKVRPKCHICKQEFKYQTYLNLHIQSVHIGIKFKCKGCDKTFGQKGNLIIHQRKTMCGKGGKD